MRAIHILILVVMIFGLIGCSSPSGSPGAPDASQGRKPAPEGVEAKMTEFVEQTAAIYRRFGQDAKAQGFRLVFTEVGPDGMEENMPDLFATLLAKASSSGVRFKGHGHAIEDGASVRDKKTGEAGIVFMISGLKDDGRGAFNVSGVWYEKPDALHEVKYHLSKTGGNWRAE